MDKNGTECIRKASQIMNFNESQKARGEEILKILEETTVEDGIEILEKCIFQHSYFGWERKYMEEPLPFGAGPSKPTHC